MDFLLPALLLGGVALVASSDDAALPGGGGDGHGAGVPARALSIDLAFDILDTAQQNGELTYNRTGDGFVDMGSTLHGVSFQYIRPDGSQAPRPIAHVDPRFAVLLLRLARWAFEKHSISTIGHLGIYPGNPASPTDCHNMGRAIDLRRFRGSGIDLDIVSDWGNKPAPYDVQHATATQYRLHPSDAGYAFFQDLYAFCVSEGADQTTAYVADQGAPPSHISDHGYVLHPDHPDPAMRPRHQNHVHLQIGPTRL